MCDPNRGLGTFVGIIFHIFSQHLLEKCMENYGYKCTAATIWIYLFVFYTDCTSTEYSIYYYICTGTYVRTRTYWVRIRVRTQYILYGGGKNVQYVQYLTVVTIQLLLRLYRTVYRSGRYLISGMALPAPYGARSAMRSIGVLYGVGVMANRYHHSIEFYIQNAF